MPPAAAGGPAGHRSPSAVRRNRRGRSGRGRGGARRPFGGARGEGQSRGGGEHSRSIVVSAATRDPPPTPAQALAAARRLVVKIGSGLLAAENGEVHRPWLNALADDVARFRSRGQEVILVSSGAIAVGRRHLGLAGRRLRLEEKQAAAATGQIRLAHAYQAALAGHGITVAQILLTLDDTEERRRHLNARSTLSMLVKLDAVPVINENDTVATSEIRFGDNDRLAARVSAMISADMLVLLSDIDGLYTADPRHDPSARHIPLA